MSAGMWIFGSVPYEPNGGISVFVERLIKLGKLPLEGLVDPYFGHKVDLPIRHVTPSGGGTLRRVPTLARLLRLGDKPLMINLSEPRRLFPLAPFLVTRRAPTVLVLHHGNLGSPKEFSHNFRTGLRRIINRFDRIGALSDEQVKFYSELGIVEDKIELIDSYIAPPTASTLVAGPRFREALGWLARTNDRPIVVGSGFARQLYNHEWTLDALESGDLPPFRYLLCCYGPRTELLSRLEARFRNAPNAFMTFGLDPAEFDALLDQADVYVRPTTVDSMGMAVFDAATKGLAIVASDICERPLGTYLHASDDEQAFRSALQQALSRRAQTAVARRGSAKERRNVVSFLADALLTRPGSIA